jgi:hypothetical protein
MKDFKMYHLNWKEYGWDNSICTAYDSSKDYGIYQVYGDHPVYGKNVLLYIGKAKEQTYSTRMKGHTDFDASQASKFTKLYLSYFCKIDDLSEETWGEAIDIVEKVLIRTHFPALNSQDVKGFLDSTTPNVLIYNWGARGSLLPEVSTLRCSEFYHNSETYDFDKLTLVKREHW